MKAIVLTKYGSPDNLVLTEVEPPRPAAGEVLVRVHAVALNEWDHGIVHARPFVNRLMFGIFRPKRGLIIGCDVSGTVEGVGEGVTRFAPGDQVFGDLSTCGWGGFAELVCADANVLATRPEALSFVEAAAIPQAGLLALQGLRLGGIAAGQRVLINGAGGGAGTFAVQIARSLDAEVTAVDSAVKLAALSELGAGRVVDYRETDFAAEGETYDLILDVLAQRSVGTFRRCLRPGGTAVLVGGRTSILLATQLVGGFGKQKVRLLMHRPSAEHSAELAALVASGEVRVVIDRRFGFDEVPAAFRRYASGEFIGKIVVDVER